MYFSPETSNEIQQIVNLSPSTKYEAFVLPGFIVYFFPFYSPKGQKIGKIEMKLNHLVSAPDYQQVIGQSFSDIYFQYDLNYQNDNNCRGSSRVINGNIFLHHETQYFHKDEKQNKPFGEFKLLFPDKCVKKNELNILRYNFFDGFNLSGGGHLNQNTNIGTLLFKMNSRPMTVGNLINNRQDVFNTENALMMATTFTNDENIPIPVTLASEKLSLSRIQKNYSDNLLPLFKITKMLSFHEGMGAPEGIEELQKIKYYYNQYNLTANLTGEIIGDVASLYQKKQLNFSLQHSLQTPETTYLKLHELLMYDIEYKNQIKTVLNHPSYAASALLLPQGSNYSFLLTFQFRLNTFFDHQIQINGNIYRNQPLIGDLNSRAQLVKIANLGETDKLLQKTNYLPDKKVLLSLAKDELSGLTFTYLRNNYVK